MLTEVVLSALIAAIRDPGIDLNPKREYSNTGKWSRENKGKEDHVENQEPEEGDDTAEPTQG